jgi:hypothetical protein
MNNTGGGVNTAVGWGALQDNGGGIGNVAVGFNALVNNTGNYSQSTGLYNTATGAWANVLGSGGLYNVADGYEALSSNKSNYNTAVGFEALFSGTGKGNVALGFMAGTNVTSGSINVHIGNYGAAGDNEAIKIGTQGTQTSTYIAGIYGVNVSGVPVYINSSGQLGVAASSRRFKEQITDMGDSSSKLFQLRPVNFFYKAEYDDGSHTLQYGLIAEEVEKVPKWWPMIATGR